MSNSPATVPFVATSQNTVSISINNETDRITKFGYRNSMLNDNFYQQVVLELGNIYKKSMELGLISQIDDTNNLYRMVLEEISKVYDGGVERTFDENEAIQEDMKLLYEEINADEMLEQSNLYINAFNDCLIQVGVKDDNFTLKLRRPDNTIVKYDDDLNLLEVYVFGGEDKGKQVWYGYTDTEAFKVEVARAEEVLEQDNMKMPLNENEDMSNPLGFLPFVSLHNGFRDDTYWQMYKGDDLVKGTIQIAIKLTFLNHLIKMQSFKQLVGTGSNLQQLHGAVLDPQTILLLDGEDTNITTLDLESNYKALWETIQAINNNIAINYKVSPNMFRLTGDISSGYALKMENLKLDKFVSKQQNRYQNAEKRLFNMLKLVDEKMGIGKIKSEGVSVEFPPTMYPKTEQEVLENQEKEIDMGTTNQVEIIMDKYGVDKETAEKIYADNIKYRNMNNVNLNAPTLDEKSTADKLGITDASA